MTTKEHELSKNKRRIAGSFRNYKKYLKICGADYITLTLMAFDYEDLGHGELTPRSQAQLLKFLIENGVINSFAENVSTNRGIIKAYKIIKKTFDKVKRLK